MTNSLQEDQLQKIFSNVNDWLKFAEAKNFGLLTLNAAIVFGLTQINFKEECLVEIVAYYFFAPIALLASFLSLVSLMPILSVIESGTTLKGCLWKVSNAIGKETLFENIHFFGYLRSIDSVNFEAKFHAKTNTNTPFTQFEKELVVQILYNARITWLKYQFFKIAGFLTLVGIGLSPLILLILKIISWVV